MGNKEKGKENKIAGLTFGAEGTEPAHFAEALPLGMRGGLQVETFAVTAAILILGALVSVLTAMT